jgi:hypothetical protein
LVVHRVEAPVKTTTELDAVVQVVLHKVAKVQLVQERVAQVVPVEQVVLTVAAEAEAVGHTAEVVMVTQVESTSVGNLI